MASRVLVCFGGPLDGQRVSVSPILKRLGMRVVASITETAFIVVVVGKKH
jgi:hypothetical protein